MGGYNVALMRERFYDCARTIIVEHLDRMSMMTVDKKTLQPLTRIFGWTVICFLWLVVFWAILIWAAALTGFDYSEYMNGR